MRTIQLIISAIADAILEARGQSSKENVNTDELSSTQKEEKIDLKNDSNQAYIEAINQEEE